MEPNAKPVAIVTSYAPRLRAYNNSLLTPVFPSTQTGPISRTTKRGTTIINYAEDGFDDLDDDTDDNRRRPTGLRSLRRDDSAAKQDVTEKAGKETFEPVDVQAQWREWMTRPKPAKNQQCAAVQASLPVTLIPIRIDIEVPSWVPPPALPLPQHIPVDPNLPQFRPQEQTVPYRLRDFFLWNLHEAIITTDMFAMCLVQDLDLPNPRQVAMEMSKQIRTQLEEYAGVALHPLFHAQPQPNGAQGALGGQNGPRSGVAPAQQENSPAPAQARSRSDTPQQNGGTSIPLITTSQAPDVAARASPILPDSDDYNPDDTYRCVITLSINLAPKLYTDKFEWSLLHPPGTAEAFAKQTCADLGLHGEWIPALTHAIYEAVLKLKKEACESGGLVGGWGGQQEIANDAAHGSEAGWRYDPESLCDEWRPRVEELTREEIEKREGDREREVRRIRRETARFSSTAGLVGGIPFAGFGNIVDVAVEEERMGRGERSKKKRRFRSLSPLARAGTPVGGRYTPDVGYGGGGGSLAEHERDNWTCAHCLIKGSCVWAVRDGPAGPKSLCNICGLLWERDRRLPRTMKNLHDPNYRIL